MSSADTSSQEAFNEIQFRLFLCWPVLPSEPHNRWVTVRSRTRPGGGLLEAQEVTRGQTRQRGSETKRPKIPIFTLLANLGGMDGNRSAARVTLAWVMGRPGSCAVPRRTHFSAVGFNTPPTGGFGEAQVSNCWPSSIDTVLYTVYFGSPARMPVCRSLVTLRIDGPHLLRSHNKQISNSTLDVLEHDRNCKAGVPPCMTLLGIWSG